MNRAVANWGKTFLRDINAGLRNISQAASMGVQGDLMSNERWGRECMLQLQEDENWNKPTATTWAAEFLLRGLCHPPGFQDFYSLHHEWRWPQ
jgi:hypothetical protein